MTNEPHQMRLGISKRTAGAILGRAAALLSRWRRRSWRGESGSESPAVVVLEPFGMGDVISLEPLVRCLHERGVQIRISARAAWRPLFQSTTVPIWLDAAIPWSSYDSGRKYRWPAYTDSSFRTYFRELRRLARGVIGIDPRGDIRSVLLLLLAGCREVIALDSYLGTELRIPSSAATLIPFREGARRWELNQRFLQPLGISEPVKPLPPRFPHLPRAQSRGDPHRIGLVPLAPWSGKLWNREKWNELARLLRAERWEVRGLCGPRQSKATSDHLCPDISVEECAGIEDWSRRLSALTCLITVDSGPMHLADALGVPVVALFGQGKLPLWAPSSISSRVVSHQTDPDFVLCHPIEANAHLGRDFMNRISVREVVEALHSVLETHERQA